MASFAWAPRAYDALPLIDTTVPTVMVNGSISATSARPWPVGSGWLSSMRPKAGSGSGGETGALADPFVQASPKDLVMQAGRPLLVVPDSVNWFDLRSVLVAWKDTPEARRAIAVSLPMGRRLE